MECHIKLYKTRTAAWHTNTHFCFNLEQLLMFLHSIDEILTNMGFEETFDTSTSLKYVRYLTLLSVNSWAARKALAENQVCHCQHLGLRVAEILVTVHNPGWCIRKGATGVSLCCSARFHLRGCPSQLTRVQDTWQHSVLGRALYGTCQWGMLELLQLGIKGVLSKCPNARDAI